VNASVQVAISPACSLGEGLHWDGARRSLWSVDIHGRRLILWDARSPQWREWTLPQRIGWVIPECRGGAVLLGLQEGIARTTPDTDDLMLEWLARPFEGSPALRLNDAKADGTGVIWGGSLNNDDERRSDGCLFRFAADRVLTEVDAGYTVANGPAISPDGKTMLHTDSARRTIYAFDFDAGAASIGAKRVWKQFAADEGYPDGMTFDADGCVWVAHWGAGCVSRFDPDGSLLRRIDFPVSLVTNVCFGGVSCDRLFVSSARVTLSASELAAQPDAGSIFEVVEPGAVGFASACWDPTPPLA
jgi:xylono-1,5-lactonase